MKAYNPKVWFSLIFQFHKTDTLRMLIPAMLGLAGLSAILCYLHIVAHFVTFRSTTVMHSLLGFVISMLLVFRTNTAYDRWWEGRRMWGELVNNSRNLMLKYKAVLPQDEALRLHRFRVLIGNYGMALKEHLRGGFKPEQLEDTDVLRVHDLEKYNHIPNRIAGQLVIETEKLVAEKIISEEKFLLMNDELKSFTSIAGACERIKGTPIPYSYSSFIKRIIFLYSITLPFGIIADLKWATIPIALFVFYILASIEVIAEEIEDPFGTDTNDLPTDDIAQRIVKNLKEMEQYGLKKSVLD